MEKECWLYVAADPSQPGAAWAACVDEPKFAKDTAKTVAGYIKDGATVMRVDSKVGNEMLRKWVRPVKKEKTESQQSLL